MPKICEKKYTGEQMTFIFEVLEKNAHVVDTIESGNIKTEAYWKKRRKEQRGCREQEQQNTPPKTEDEENTTEPATWSSFSIQI